MPTLPPHPCSHPHCPALTTTRTCPEHKPKRPAQLYDTRWRTVRRAWLAEHPICVICEQEGHTGPATIVDHITPHRGDERLMWNLHNLQSLCKRHHDTKTAREMRLWEAGR